MRQIIFVLLLCSLTAPAFAQEEDGTEGPSEPQCALSNGWRVIATELPDAPGMTMDLNKRDASGEPNCKTKAVKPDFTIGGPDQALWFTALSNEFIVLARTTGPTSNLVIQNLADKAVLVDIVSNEVQPDSWGVTYWAQKEPATIENCPDFNGFTSQGYTAVISHEMRFDFATKGNLISGQKICEPQQ